MLGFAIIKIVNIVYVNMLISYVQLYVRLDLRLGLSLAFFAFSDAGQGPLAVVCF